MERKIILITTLILGMLFPNILVSQTNSAKQNLEKLSNEGLKALWANRTIVDIYFDKESLVTNGLLDSSDRNYLLNSTFPSQQYQRSKKFVDIILDGALEGKFKVFDYLTEMPMTHEQIMQIYEHTDSISMAIPDPPYQRDTIVRYVLNREHVLKYHVMMDWVYDQKTGNLKTKVLGIAPCLSKYDYYGYFKGYYPLFWICF